jgi:hypothetical protein
MAAEVLAGLGAFKTMFDMAKGLKEMNDAAIRNGAVIELQEQILSAQAAQAALIERVRALEAEVASFEKWEADKQKYELKEIRPGVLVYALKKDAGTGEPTHLICAHCYQQRQKSILHTQGLDVGRAELLVCPRCGTEMYSKGHWYKEHGNRGRSAPR